MLVLLPEGHTCLIYAPTLPALYNYFHCSRMDFSIVKLHMHWLIAVSALILLSHCQGFLPLWPESSQSPPLYNWLFLVLVGQIVIFVQVPGSLSLLSVGVSNSKLKIWWACCYLMGKDSQGLLLLSKFISKFQVLSWEPRQTAEGCSQQHIFHGSCCSAVT